MSKTQKHEGDRLKSSQQISGKCKMRKELQVLGYSTMIVLRSQKRFTQMKVDLCCWQMIRVAILKSTSLSSRLRIHSSLPFQKQTFYPLIDH